MRLPSRKSLAVLAVALGAIVLGTGAALFTSTFSYPPTGGEISPYQVGFYDLHEGDASVYLVNPTPYDLVAYVVQYDDCENPVRCEQLHLSPNDLEEFEITCNEPGKGVIKIVTVKPPVPGQTVWIQSGVVGWVRHYLPSNGWPGGIADTELRSVPAALLSANSNYEINRILGYVQENCGID